MKVTIKMFLHWRREAWMQKPDYVYLQCDITGIGGFENYVCLGEREIEVEVPDDFDPRPSMIDGLRKQQKQVLADAQMKATQIEERIQQLLCIEHKPETQAVPPCEHDWMYRPEIDLEECARCCETRDRVPA